MQDKKINILAFETSCDETSVAVLENDRVLSNIILSQEYHIKFGGVVPEVASREHLKRITDITASALEKAGMKINDINMIAATSEPGLIGAVLIGLSFAKSVAATLNVPFVHVNHIQAHLYSSFIKDTKPEFPFLGLIVSGGHTLLILVEDFFKHKILGTTVDDAAGEAFDKVAKMLGLGYPGGPLIDKHASDGDINFHKFPISRLKDSKYNFSFSGIKTSVLYFLRSSNFQEIKSSKLINDICASFQHAVIKTLYDKVLLAAKEYGIKDITISGGVSANSYLKKTFGKLEDKGYRIFIPELIYSTDNAAMIGITAYYKYINSQDKKYFDDKSLNVNARPRLDFANF
ncbi:MAG: tRNA (adenosine(37)-N6)-threonylcarbamoyltransferase complex transferase subunit TsaD [Ignavibacteria bacterium]|nr:tRNA (adenosine(37)-N6)-threonylcarbamoyltransferase complex transferase subunit TsaD [Ignavibacteria bacterium]